jgi:hypothetical protein
MGKASNICGAGTKCCCGCILVFTACCPICGGQKTEGVPVKDWLDLEEVESNKKCVGAPVEILMGTRQEGAPVGMMMKY